jgi:hypothetical protein
MDNILNFDFCIFLPELCALSLSSLLNIHILNRTPDYYQVATTDVCVYLRGPCAPVA